MTTKKLVVIQKWENGFYWIIDLETGEPLDGDKRKRVVIDMCKRWGYKIVNL